MTTLRFLALVLTAPLAIACTTDSSLDDELATDDAVAGDASKADAASGTYTYYQLEPDLRACAEPYCGGVFYRLANATTTRCSDGTKQERCHAPFVDWSRLGLGASAMDQVQRGLGAGTLLVRSTIGSKSVPPAGSFAELRPSEAWTGQGPNTAHGPLAKIEDSGVRCIAFPCPSLSERKLNSSAKASIAELGWDVSGATGEQISQALRAMHETGLIIAGDRYTVTGPGGEGKARSVTQFWQRVTDVPKTCVVTGCSGQICSDHHVASTCEFRPEYACYDAATCEVQADGECGWTQTAELQACLQN